MKTSCKMVPAVVTIFLAICICSYAAVSTKRGVVVPYDNYRCDDLATLTGINWWYTKGLSLPTAVDGPCSVAPVQEHVPMKWHQYGVGEIGEDIHAGTKYLYSFLEPNWHFGANITPEKAANKHKIMEASLKAAGRSDVKILAPTIAIMHCILEPNDCTPPWQHYWLDQFMGNCSATNLNCSIHAIPMQHELCESSNIQGIVAQTYNRYNYPIWLTSYPCPTATTEQTIRYMKKMIDVAEGPSYGYMVERYAWNATRMSDDGEKVNQLFEENSSDLKAVGDVWNSHMYGMP